MTTTRNRLMLTAILAVVLVLPNLFTSLAVWNHSDPATDFVALIVGVGTALYAHFIVTNYRIDTAA